MRQTVGAKIWNYKNFAHLKAESKWKNQFAACESTFYKRLEKTLVLKRS